MKINIKMEIKVTITINSRFSIERTEKRLCENALKLGLNKELQHRDS